MSQAGKLNIGAPVGAGIETIQGDIGLPAGPDGLGNFLVVGAGGITTSSNPATNTLTITNNVIAAEFAAEVGSAFPVGGLLHVIGTANQLTTAAAGNTVQVAFTNDVVMPHDLTVTHDFIVNGESTFNDDVSVAAGKDLTASYIYGTSAITTPHSVVTAELDMDVGSVIKVSDFGSGVVQCDGATHYLFCNKGTDGQILIGSSAGAPAWNTIVSDGSIDITNGANSISVATANTVATSFYTSDGNFAVPALKRLNIYGGTNVNTVAAGNTVTVNLNNSINVANSVQAGTTITAGTGIASTAGNITATTGSLVSNQMLTVQNGGMNITGSPVFNSLNVGVAHINAAKQLIGINSTADGQVLIGSGTPGVLPTWNTLTAGPGITIDNSVPANISISAPGAGSGLYVFKGTLSVPDAYDAVTGAAPYYYGQTAAMVEQYDPDNAFYPGDGAGNPAQFTVPFNGIYSFTINCSVGASAPTPAGYFQARFMHFDFVNVTAGNYTRVTEYIGAALGIASPLYYCNGQATQYLNLTAGQIIRFRHVTSLVSPATAASIRIINFGRDFQGNGTAFVSGYLVRSL